MTLIADLIRRSTAIYALLSVLNGLLVVAGCAFFSVSLFRLQLRKKALPAIVCAALCVLCGLADPFTAQMSDGIALLLATVELLLPFLCMALLFCRPGRWKAMLVAVGYTFVEALRFLVLLLFFGFDNNSRDDALELLVGFLVNVGVFFLAYLFLTRYARRRTLYLDVTKDGAVLFLLMVASVAVFVTSLMLLGSAYSETRQTEFAFMLLNIPILTATASFALVRFFRARSESDNYKKQLQMQIRQFEWMEQMYEEVRVFRHDFPKKMRPLITYLDEDRPDDAREMAQQFSDFVAQSGERFHTGNYRLDTVLFCEQQLAQKEGARIVVPFGAAFPQTGIEPDDIYTIFPNALDNAIEACRSAAGEKEITFTSSVRGHTVYVTIRNPVSGEVKQKNGVPQTSKPDKAAHGYGFRSIKKAAAKYGDDNVSFSVENGVFELRIFLNIPAETPAK